MSRVLVLEKCLWNLDYYCREMEQCRTIVSSPSDRQVLLQMARGLHYIHSQDLDQYKNTIIHRDVRPDNILISYSKDPNAFIKWADFGLSRVLDTSASRSFTWSGQKGHRRWLAPELIQKDDKIPVRSNCSSDTWALGCVFFFFLVPAVHPFGSETYEIRKNVKKANRVYFNSNNNDTF